MDRDREMLVALGDGVVDDEGTLVQIKRGKTRIAPEVLASRPEYGHLFDRSVSAPHTDALRARYRIRTPDGRVLAG
jgi:hypothetical protein